MQHFYENVPGFFGFQRLYEDVAKNLKDGQLLVEVGSWFGRSAAFMGVEIANSGKDVEFVCIDPWQDGGPDLVGTKFEVKTKDELYLSFLRNVEPVKDHIKPLRMTSLEAVNAFEDESIDFLMLDGDHNYPMVKREIQAYMPKMKKGGIISGDDYLWPGVTQSVEETIGSSHCGIRVYKRTQDYRKSVSHWFYRVKS